MISAAIRVQIQNKKAQEALVRQSLSKPKPAVSPIPRPSPSPRKAPQATYNTTPPITQAFRPLVAALDGRDVKTNIDIILGNVEIARKNQAIQQRVQKRGPPPCIVEPFKRLVSASNNSKVPLRSVTKCDVRKPTYYNDMEDVEMADADDSDDSDSDSGDSDEEDIEEALRQAMLELNV